MKLELMNGDSVEVSNDTAMNNCQGLPLNKCTHRIECWISITNIDQNVEI